MLFRRYIAYTIIPIGLLAVLALNMLHRKSFNAFLTRTYISTVTTAEAVKHVYLLYEPHTGKIFAHSRNSTILGIWRGLQLFFIKNKRTNRRMRTHIGTFIALYTVLRIPFGYESGHSALLVTCRTRSPCTVLYTSENTHRQQIAVLGIYRTYYIGYKLGSAVIFSLFITKRGPGRIHRKFVIFATTVYGLVIHINHIFTLLAIRLVDEFLHLLDSKFDRYDLCYTEKRRLQNSICTVTQTYFLGNL